jgi:fermentation-respiration switch protein FrsA (DUF1100 family)
MAPILFIHGRKDTLIPPRHSETLCQLAEQSSSKTMMIANLAEHAGGWDMKVDVIESVQMWFGRVLY